MLPAVTEVEIERRRIVLYLAESAHAVRRECAGRQEAHLQVATSITSTASAANGITARTSTVLLLLSILYLWLGMKET